jgi:hypothetical protein
MKPGSENFWNSGSRVVGSARGGAALLQGGVLRGVGGAEHVALRRVVLQVLQQPLIGDLAGGADDRHRDAGIFRGEGTAHALGGFGIDLGDIPGDAGFLAGGGEKFRGDAGCPGLEWGGRGQGAETGEQVASMDHCFLVFDRMITLVGSAA